MKNARKYIIIAVALLLSVAAHAQIYLSTDEDHENSDRVLHNSTTPFVPYQGGDFDQTPYTPLGGGWLLLTGLGAAYLMHKRKKDDE